MKDNKIRLQKFIADNGIASRRKAEELIAEAITLEANKEYIYGILDAALMLKLITKKEWLNALKDKAE